MQQLMQCSVIVNPPVVLLIICLNLQYIFLVPTVYTAPIIYYILSVIFPLLASERDDATQQLLQRPVVVGQPKQPPQDTVEREEVFERR